MIITTEKTFFKWTWLVSDVPIWALFMQPEKPHTFPRPGSHPCLGGWVEVSHWRQLVKLFGVCMHRDSLCLPHHEPVFRSLAGICHGFQLQRKAHLFCLLWKAVSSSPEMCQRLRRDLNWCLKLGFVSELGASLSTVQLAKWVTALWITVDFQNSSKSRTAFQEMENLCRFCSPPGILKTQLTWMTSQPTTKPEQILRITVKSRSFLINCPFLLLKLIQWDRKGRDDPPFSRWGNQVWGKQAVG